MTGRDEPGRPEFETFELERNDNARVAHAPPIGHAPTAYLVSPLITVGMISTDIAARGAVGGGDR
ncbi:hypothetical protein [Nonomuraea jiangxiensis]|uniref:hypothetical protein n=1 Tax=Nonomuraea jiangxiensis TaxID=633440 RepID=UPI0015A3291F|nr:hypothetical protein [Nonomuraea jiangxiensis]